jgi:hypothetical protein
VEIAESLQLSANGHRHLMPGGVAIGKNEHHHGPAIFGTVLGHAV